MASQQLSVATSRTAYGFIQNIVGKPAYQVVAFDYKRDASGNIVTDPAYGHPCTRRIKAYGSAFGKWLGGFTSEFNYKHVVLSFIIDGKVWR